MSEPGTENLSTPRTKDLWERWAWPALLGALAVLGAHLLDQRAYHALLSDNPELLNSRDWFRALRVMGHWPVWFAVGLTLVIIDSAPPASLAPARPWQRGPFLWLSTGLAGLLAEGLKLLLSRARPIDTDGAYAFAKLGSHGWNTSDFGLPSSHAAVAFAAAFALGHLHPRAGWVLVPLAAGCGLTRVLVGQHFLSDVAAGACVGLAVPAFVTALHRLATRGGAPR